MANFRFSVSKPAVTACALISASLVSGCSSIERTPMEQLMAVQTVTPLPKPGTEMTAYALPAPDGVAATTAALAAETAMMKPGETAATQVAATNQTETPAVAANALVAPQTSAAAQAATAAVLPDTANTMVSAKSDRMPQIPEGMMMAAMESDFDTGEPVGLETLVAKRMIVPMAKPSIGASAYAMAKSIPASLGITEKPTSSRPELDRLIAYYAKLNNIPEELVHRVVKRESTYNPRAYHAGNYGLMQIRYNTAKGLGYEGPAEGLFDAETNLKYATKYLAGAWMVADNQNDGAVKLYASGYYYHAKRKGLLETLGMK
ncbi:lytic transglycosylase domain-containing protein [Rhizobium sp. LjRoot98]|uniref:lytic transglycosylase domain-containing protein n=1 Tax=unclassified Rhizobium TaxID=2613769 RepID=UPI000713B1A5|nr:MULTISPECIES: lytic transglycosylase domain-containing protein [unclassified Rhizobium]KQV28779.1 lytic transglycosylase [Rhizobium sp. Root1204]KQY05266.1 lytic transglycosylase [Rhizobium sp. Root1334]KRC01886.1 lytic transglycosylase [Rhizobium sp. Root73]